MDGRRSSNIHVGGTKVFRLKRPPVEGKKKKELIRIRRLLRKILLGFKSIILFSKKEKKGNNKTNVFLKSTFQNTQDCSKQIKKSA